MLLELSDHLLELFSYFKEPVLSLESAHVLGDVFNLKVAGAATRKVVSHSLGVKGLTVRRSVSDVKNELLGHVSPFY